MSKMHTTGHFELWVLILAYYGSDSSSIFEVKNIDIHWYW